MPNSLTDPPVRPVLDRLFQAADQDGAQWVSIRERHPDGFAAMSAREQPDAYGELYIPVSRHHSTVHAGTSTGYVLILVDDSADKLSERQQAEVQRLIRRDHDFHERRRR